MNAYGIDYNTVLVTFYFLKYLNSILGADISVLESLGFPQ